MITFEEDQSFGYRERTIKNATADLTLAFALDFNSAGERLTTTAVRENKKKYVPIHVMGMGPETMKRRIQQVTHLLFGYTITTINVAGNGIYTMRSQLTQQECDDFTYDFINQLLNVPHLMMSFDRLKLIRSGGQTGFDEAGLKAAVRLGIPALCLAPKGWKFRNINGVDISDEKQFKARFNV